MVVIWMWRQCLWRCVGFGEYTKVAARSKPARLKSVILYSYQVIRRFHFKVLPRSPLQLENNIYSLSHVTQSEAFQLTRGGLWWDSMPLPNV